MSVRFALAGLPALGSKSEVIVLPEGVRPGIFEFDFARGHAEELLRTYAGKPVTLEVDDGKKREEFRFLYILHFAPGPDPHVVRVAVADRRWLWSYVLVKRDYNVRRNTGSKRLTDVSTPELQPITDEVRYAAYSLRNRSKAATAAWRVKPVLQDVLEEVFSKEREYAGVTPPLSFESEFSAQALDFPIEDLFLRHPGDQAVSIALRKLPEAGIRLDKAGRVTVIAKGSGKDKAMIASAGPEKFGMGHIELARNAYIRPRNVAVHFVVFGEIRTDAVEQSSRTTTASRSDFDLYSQNVLQVTDFDLTVNGESVSQGNWLPIPEALTAWGPAPGLGTLDYPLIRKALVPFVDFWAGVQAAGNRDPDQDWNGRIGALQTHFRRTYMLNRNVRDNLGPLLPYRISTLDAVTNQRAPAMVYMNYCTLPTQRSMWDAVGSGPVFPYLNPNIFYPQNTNGPVIDGVATGKLDPQSKPAPWKLDIVDSDQGVFSVEFQQDPARVYEQALPSLAKMESSTTDANGMPAQIGPTGDITQLNVPITFDALSEASLNDLPELTPNDKKLFIFSAMVVAPNGKNALYRVEVSPDDVRDMLAPGAQEGLAEAFGPTMDVFVPISEEVARVAWVDDRREDLLKILGLDEGTPNMDGLVVNADEGANRIGSASLRSIAEAYAASIYSMLADRMVGSATYDYQPHLVPAGYISEVSHGVDPDGHMFSTITSPATIPQLNMATYLNSGDRNLLMRIAIPGKTA